MVKTIFEVSFECGNKVGGIWSVITTKSRVALNTFGKNNYYFRIGADYGNAV